MTPAHEISPFFWCLSHPGCEHHTNIGSHVHQDTEKSSPPEPFSPALCPSCKHSEGDDTAKETFYQKKKKQNTTEMRFTYVFREKYQVFPVKKMKVLETRLQKGFAMGLSPVLAVQENSSTFCPKGKDTGDVWLRDLCRSKSWSGQQLEPPLNAAVGEESLWNAEFPSACSQEYWEW